MINKTSVAGKNKRDPNNPPGSKNYFKTGLRVMFYVTKFYLSFFTHQTPYKRKKNNNKYMYLSIVPNVYSTTVIIVADCVKRARRITTF